METQCHVEHEAVPVDTGVADSYSKCYSNVTFSCKSELQP